ncbi:MAG: hypothetical protein GY828_02620, partial [Candidatus Gracilibacteria bacterium]|nr:hypothetical protein [Candidatus Gracilibacteria bacterium]
MKFFSKILLALSVLATAACSEKTKTVEVEGSTEIVTVEVEQQPIVVSLNLTAFGVPVQDDSPVVIFNDEAPESYYVDYINVILSYVEDGEVINEIQYNELM